MQPKKKKPNPKNKKPANVYLLLKLEVESKLIENFVLTGLLPGSTD